MTLRAITAADWPRVLELNGASVTELSALDEQRLGLILSLAHSSLVVEQHGEVVAFAIAIAPGTSYDSRNYGWFNRRFARFLYLDRIAVAADRRRSGIATLLYDAIERAGTPFQRMVCDVNVKPRNDASLRFHAARGYRRLGLLSHGSDKTVALFSKQLGGDRQPPGA